jgi:hypothetical protein
LARYDYDRSDYTYYFERDRRESDRLERMMDDLRREMDREERRPDPIMEVVNNPLITLTPIEKKAINDPQVMMNPDRSLVKISKKASTGREIIRSSGQFTNMGIPIKPGKRTRKKTKMDKTMSRCLKEANRKLRLKNGKLKKGKTMRDVMLMAHRLCKRS